VTLGIEQERFAYKDPEVVVAYFYNTWLNKFAYFGVTAMADLAGLQKRLNKDAEFRAKFMKSPAKVLAAEGLSLTPKMKADLKEMVARAAKPRRAASGSSAGAVEDGVMISISKSF
jgi:hypothetical protein